MLKNQQPKDAVYNIEHFHLELTKKMPHLMKTTQLAQFLIYSNYIPFQLTEGIFPVPPIGEEFTDAYVPLMKSKIKYENMYGVMVEKEEYGWTQPRWKEEITKNCKDLAENPSPEKDFIEQILDQIKKYETLDEILHAIHKLSLATDVCFYCIWLKHKVPGKIINLATPFFSSTNLFYLLIKNKMSIYYIQHSPYVHNYFLINFCILL